MAVLAGCQQKGKSEGQTSGTVATDSLGEVTDTVPKPIFLIKRMSFFEMNYWTDVEEPSKEKIDEESNGETAISYFKDRLFADNLYLLDEPIGGVDPATRDYILNTIIRNYNPEAAVVISTHLIADVEQVLDEVLFLQNGRIVLHDTVDAIRNEKGTSVDALFREVFRC